MCASYYTYKVEFQDRGAAHIHGTLWVNLDELEEMVRGVDGELRAPAKEQNENKNKDGNEKDKKGYLDGLKLAFRKLRKNEKLNNEDKEVLAKFIDEFTTVSIHGNTVGKYVAEIAQEVNKHHHTKTCRKHDTTCRFKYPRFPSPRTIIVTPCYESNSEKRDKILAEHREVLRKVK